MTWHIAAFYKFTTLDNLAERQRTLSKCGKALELCGTILIAEEGINSTIAGSDAALATFLAELRTDPAFAGLKIKASVADAKPFGHFKVKLKPEIVTFGHAKGDPRKGTGTYVAPENWNALISDPDVILIDTRNDYEVAIGTFAGAHNPKTSSFRDFPDFIAANVDPKKHRKVAMFCTGGIRCEKATAFMLRQGFENVYHLQGGILNYLECVSPDQSTWQGECFVFDDRVSVDHQLSPGSYSLCRSCGSPVMKDATPSVTGRKCPACNNDPDRPSSQSWQDNP